MNFKSVVVAATVALAFAASAQESVPTVLTLTPAGSSLSTSFERSVNGLFVETFSFLPASVAGLVSVTLTPASGPVNFFSALLNDEGFSFLPELGLTSFSFQARVGAGSPPLSLTVFGYAGDAETLTDALGSYRGTVQVQTIAAVPEPQTYALMLIGMAALGGVAWRSRPARAERRSA